MSNKQDQQKVLVLLGAGADQLFAIKTGKALGYFVLVFDSNPASPGFDLADDSAVVSTRDVLGIISYLKTYRYFSDIAGITVMGSDIPEIVAEVAQFLKTPALSLTAAIKACHKYKMKQCFAEQGVPIPAFRLLADENDLAVFIEQQGLPVVIKPVDRSGARGVFLLDGRGDWRSLYQRSLAESFCGQVLAEEYLLGLQLSTESIIKNSAVITAGIADRNYEKLAAFAPHIIENGGWVPSVLSSEQLSQVDSLISKASKALGIRDGIIKGDLVLTAEGPKIIEVAARLSGGDFSESLIPLGYGVNIVEAGIRLATGEEFELSSYTPEPQLCVANRYFFPPPGRLLAIHGVELVRQQSWVQKLAFSYEVGCTIPPLRSHADRFGMFIVQGKNRSQVEERIQWVYETIRIEIA